MDRFAPQDELVFLPLRRVGRDRHEFQRLWLWPARRPAMDHRRLRRVFGREGSTPGVDLIMPDIRFLAERRDNVLGIVATHAHEDHIGAIAPLWPTLRCPVYATPFTGAADHRQAGRGGPVRPRCMLTKCRSAGSV